MINMCCLYSLVSMNWFLFFLSTLFSQSDWFVLGIEKTKTRTHARVTNDKTSTANEEEEEEEKYSHINSIPTRFRHWMHQVHIINRCILCLCMEWEWEWVKNKRTQHCIVQHRTAQQNAHATECDKRETKRLRDD